MKILMSLAIGFLLSFYLQNKQSFSLECISQSQTCSVAVDTVQLSVISSMIKRGEYGDINSLIIYRNNSLTFETYYGKYKATRVHGLQSATKSIASLLIGILLDRGYIKSIDQRIADIFPEYNFNDSLKHGITIRNLLLMSSGISWNEGKVDLEDAKLSDIRLLNESKDYLEYYFNKPMSATPGSVFQYSGGCSIALGEIIRRTSHLTVEQFANAFLFQPLGITKYEWTRSKSGQYNTGGGLYLLPKDFAKIGLLVMNKGKWNGQQIVSGNWIKESLTPGIRTDWKNDYGHFYEYGYQWWSVKLNDVETVSARGWGDQRLVLIPQFDMIIAINATNFFNKKERKKVDELLSSILKATSDSK